MPRPRASRWRRWITPPTNRPPKSLRQRATLFPVETDPLHDQPLRVSKFALGYAYKFPHTGPVGLSVGALGSLYAKPGALDAAYGKAPKSFVLFARLGLGH